MYIQRGGSRKGDSDEGVGSLKSIRDQRFLLSSVHHSRYSGRYHPHQKGGRDSPFRLPKIPNGEVDWRLQKRISFIKGGKGF